jgi:hypothetical protein
MGRERPHSDLIERGWHFIADEIRALPDPRIAYPRARFEGPP